MKFALVLSLFLPFTLATCPTGTSYEKVFDKCYKYINQSAPFLLAERTCESLGGHLVAIQNAFENSFLSGMVLGVDSKTSAYWIGANYLLTNNWTWIYNDSFAYSNWAAGQPSDPSIYQCGEVRTSNYFWYKQLCNVPRPFVCSMNPNTVITTPISPACSTSEPTCPPEPSGNSTCSGRCSSNYTMSPVDCKCYNWPTALPMSFNDTLNFCQSQGASLVKITTKAQNSWLSNWIATNFPKGGHAPWIGLSCPGTTRDSCYWADDSPLICYDNFDNDYPDGGLSNWDGKNPHFFLRVFVDTDYGEWLRWEVQSDQTTYPSALCMLDPIN